MRGDRMLSIISPIHSQAGFSPDEKNPIPPPHSPVDSVSLNPGKPVLIDPQHQLKASSHTLDVLGALRRTKGKIHSDRTVSLLRAIRRAKWMLEGQVRLVPF